MKYLVVAAALLAYSSALRPFPAAIGPDMGVAPAKALAAADGAESALGIGRRRRGWDAPLRLVLRLWQWRRAAARKVEDIPAFHACRAVNLDSHALIDNEAIY